MTPKEKAQYLYDKFAENAKTLDYDSDTPLPFYVKRAVNDIIDEIIIESDLYEFGNPILLSKRKDFWKEVKIELESL